MAAPQAASRAPLAGIAGRLAEFAKACKAATRIVSMYPSTHPAIQSALARIGEATKQATTRAVHDHGAARRAAGQRPRPREARIVGDRAGRAAPPAADRRADAVRSRSTTTAGTPSCRCWRKSPEDARADRRRGKGVGGNRQQGDRDDRDRLRRNPARARRRGRERDVGPHPHRAQGRRRGASAAAGAAVPCRA